MKDDTKARLNQILSAYDERIAETARREAAILAAKTAFPQRFAALKKEMFLPLFRELAEVLNGKGHDATVRDEEESSSTVGSVNSAAVGLRVVPKPLTQKSADSKRSYVEILFSANRSERKIVVTSTNTIIHSGGGVGKRGEYEVDGLTADVVTDHVLRTLEEALKGG
jgi:hypothetical protein